VGYEPKEVHGVVLRWGATWSGGEKARKLVGLLVVVPCSCRQKNCWRKWALVDLRAAVMLVVVSKSWLRGSMMPCRGMAQCNLAQLVLRKWKGGL
jgi:hypothetical protein